MNHEIKAAWLHALRSGEYRQGRNMLRSKEDAFCCLGVLFDSNKEKFPDFYWHPSGKYYFLGNKMGTLPLEVESICGIPAQAQNILADMNDLERKSFNEIADWIEENL